MEKKSHYAANLTVLKMIGEIYSLSMIAANRVLRKLNITVDQAIVLYTLDKYGVLSQKELAELIFKDQANTTRLLKRLLDKNLICIEVSKKDKRIKLLSLSDSSYTVLGEIDSVLNELQRDLDSFFPEDLRKNLFHYLHEYYDIFRNSSDLDDWYKSLS